MTEQLDDTPRPGLAKAFDLVLVRAEPLVVGRLGTGGRRLVVTASGSLAGSGLSGSVVAAEEVLLDRPDGVTVVEASYCIECEGGITLRAFGKGYHTDFGEFSGLRMTLLFEADEDGPVADLVAAAFVAEEAPGSSHIEIYKVT